MYVCIHVHTYTHIHAYIYIYIHTNTLSLYIRLMYGKISMDEQVRVICLSQSFYCSGDTCSVRAQYKVVPRML